MEMLHLFIFTNSASITSKWCISFPHFPMPRYPIKSNKICLVIPIIWFQDIPLNPQSPWTKHIKILGEIIWSGVFCFMKSRVFGRRSRWPSSLPTWPRRTLVQCSSRIARFRGEFSVGAFRGPDGGFVWLKRMVKRWKIIAMGPWEWLTQTYSTGKHIFTQLEDGRWWLFLAVF